MPDYGKSCCGCCPKGCTEHVNLRAQDRHYVRIQGLDGKQTFLYMGPDFEKAAKFSAELHALLQHYSLPTTEEHVSLPSCAVGSLEKCHITNYEELWQAAEAGKVPYPGYNPFDY